MNARIRRRHWLVPFLLSFALIAAACGDDDTTADTADGGTTVVDTADTGTDTGTDTGGGSDIASATGSVNISGSSTVGPISIRVKELAEEAGSAIDVTVDEPGTTDGFEIFCQGETDIQDASRAISEEEITACADGGVEYVELLIAYDGIAVLTNPANEDVTCLTFEQIYGLMGPESTVSNWSEADPALPDLDFVISAPGPESGTYDSFIEIVLEDQADAAGVTEEPFIRQDFSGNPDDNIIIQGIGGADGSFGWVGFAYAEANADSVKVLEVDGGEGCIAPSIETIADASYPVSRPLYIYVNKAKAEENAAVAAFVDFYLGDAYTEAVTEAFGPDAGYVPLPDDILAETQATWDGR